jgi:hypothetical protein
MSRDPSTSVEPFGYSLYEEVTLKYTSQEGTSGNFHFVDVYGASVEEGDNGGGGWNQIGDALKNGGVPNDVYAGRHYWTETGINGGNVLKAFVSNNFPEGNGSDYIWCDHSYPNDWDDVFIGPDGTGLVEFKDVGEDPGANAPDGWDGRCRRIILVPVIVNDEYPPGDPLRYNWSDVHGSKKILVVGFAYLFVTDWGTQGKDMWIDGVYVKAYEHDAAGPGPLTPWGSIHYWLVD